MSLGNVTLLRMPGSDDRIVYEVRSQDFSAVPGVHALIGYLSIEPGARKYSFSAAGELAGQSLAPPALFELEEAEVARKLQTEYQGYGAVLWMRRLSKLARRFMERGEYPEEYPGQS